MSAAPCRHLLQQAARLLTFPDGPSVFLHDDLISARQVMLVNGECMLLDFEMAKFGHPLLDISRSLAGKFDRKAGTSTYVLKHLDAPASLAETYRRQLAALGGPVFTDSDWDQAIGAAIVFTSVINLGAQHCAPPRVMAKDGFQQTRKKVLERLRALIEDNRTFAPITAALEALTKGVVDTRR